MRFFFWAGGVVGGGGASTVLAFLLRVVSGFGGCFAKRAFDLFCGILSGMHTGVRGEEGRGDLFLLDGILLWPLDRGDIRECGRGSEIGLRGNRRRLGLPMYHASFCVLFPCH
ncbi:hypothetical protein BDY17DRAFT_304479, partial [Neohortaea acidophila]